jgi:DNA-binding NarL/FixJ family response regulator
VDDHPLFREGLRQMIERYPDLEVCGEAPDAEQAIKALNELKPDLVLVDISLGGTNGLDLIRLIKEQNDEMPVLVISMHDESLYAERSLRAGAMGYVMKHEPVTAVRAALTKVLSGEIYLSEKMSAAMLSKLMRGKSEHPVSPLENLSDRELEVFQMLGQGKGSRQIAAELNLTIPTINSFRARIKEKLNLKSSTEVMLHAIHWVREGGTK